MGFGSRRDFQFFRVLQDGQFVFRLVSVKIVDIISESRRNFQLFFENIFWASLIYRSPLFRISLSVLRVRRSRSQDDEYVRVSDPG